MDIKLILGYTFQTILEIISKMSFTGETLINYQQES